MTDNILGVIDDCKCPQCGSKKMVCHMQCPLIVTLDMKGQVIRRHPRTGKRMKLSNKYKARLFDSAISDFQMAQYQCKNCGWVSKAYTP